MNLTRIYHTLMTKKLLISSLLGIFKKIIHLLIYCINVLKMKYNKYKQILKINIYIKYKGKFAYNQ